MPPTINRPGLSTGQKHHIRVASRDWTGVLRRLIDDREGDFKAHLPLRPRGPQVVIDPFEPTPAKVSVRGTVFSPGRVLDPTSQVEAWIDGAAVTGITEEGRFGAQVTLHEGHDQIHVRAKDTTKREGRGYVGTWIPGAAAPPPEILPVETVRTQRIRMRLEDEDGEPLADLPYELTCAGDLFTGITDGNGYLTHQVSADATTGELTFWLDADKSGESYTWPLRIADIKEKPAAGGGGQTVGRGAAAVYCGALGGFVRAGQTRPDGTAVPAPRPLQRPARYGAVRAEVQRFRISPPLKAEVATADLVLKDGDDAEVGRCTVKLERSQMGTLTEWVCITAADPGADPAPPAIEGKLIRVPDVKHTIEIKVGEVLIGNRPVRFSGWDPQKPPTGLAKVERETTGEIALGGVVGGQFDEPEQLALRWMVDADEDDVLLPGARSAEQDASLNGVVSQNSAALAGEDPVDLTEQKAAAPLGWSSLGVENEANEDPFPEEQSVSVVTYHEAEAAGSPDASDFVHTPRPTRAVWHDTEGWVTHPDQLLVTVKDGTDDAAVDDLCKKLVLRVAGAIRRDRQFLLESREPLELGELTAVLDKAKAESCVDSAAYNLISAPSAEDVSTIRVPDLLRRQAADPLGPIQAGGVNSFEVLALRHNLQVRSLPAQQLIERLSSQVTSGPAPSVLLAVCDSGFGNGTHPAISPDFDVSRFPLGGRRVGSLTTQLSLTAPNFIEPPPYLNPALLSYIQDGHGTLCLHNMAGAGTPFRGPGAPALTATAPMGGLANEAWSLGTCPTAQVLPIRIANNNAGTSVSNEVQGVRFAFLQTGVKVVNLSWGATHPAAGLAALQASDRTAYQPALDAARAAGAILVVAAGNRGVPIARQRPAHLGPTAARATATDPMIVVTPTSQTLIRNTPLGFAFPQTFPNPWGSFESGTLDNFTTNSGPEASVSAPGDGLIIRLSSLTAATWQQEVSWGSGTSFAAPIVSGLFGLMHLADQLANPGVVRAGNAAADFANKLIDLVQYTSRRAQPLFSAAEETAQYSTILGHGRIDCWGAVLSTLNGGPMQHATAAHANLTNIGAFVAPADVKYYGFELDTRAFQARPLLVNADTGVVSELTDGHGLDPAIGAGGGARTVFSWMLRDGGPGDQLLPCTEHPGPDAQYALQFSIARAQLAAYTHLAFRRPGAASGPPVSTTYYGLPLAPLLNHDTTGADIAPFGVSLTHFVAKAKTDDFDRRLRVTFDRVVLPAGAGAGDWNLTGTAAGTSTGQRTVRGKAGPRPTFLDGPEWSTTVVVPADGDLVVALEGSGPGGATIAPVTGTFSGRSTPADPTTLPYGIGTRRLTGPNGLEVHVTIEHEPAIARKWVVELCDVICTGPIRPGAYRFCVEAENVRSGWTTPPKDVSAAAIDDKVHKIHHALRRKVLLFINDVDQDELFTTLEGASAIERQAIEHRFRELYGHEWTDLRAALDDKLDGDDQTRAFRALDQADTTPVQTGGATAKAPWIPGQRLQVVFRWQERDSLEFDLAVHPTDLAALAAKSASTSARLVAGPFTATVSISSE